MAVRDLTGEIFARQKMAKDRREAPALALDEAVALAEHDWIKAGGLREAMRYCSVNPQQYTAYRLAEAGFLDRFRQDERERLAAGPVSDSGQPRG